MNTFESQACGLKDGHDFFQRRSFKKLRLEALFPESLWSLV